MGSFSRVHMHSSSTLYSYKRAAEHVPQKGDRIQISIRNPHRWLFEDDLAEGNIYTISNFSLSSNNQKYKPTNHAQQIYFKRDTQIRTVQDNSFPMNMFRFVPNELTLNHTNARSHFIG
ncbi:hypothetical protein AAHE18_05G100500 [Arachis hypogaea]